MNDTTDLIYRMGNQFLIKESRFFGIIQNQLNKFFHSKTKDCDENTPYESLETSYANVYEIESVTLPFRVLMFDTYDRTLDNADVMIELHVKIREPFVGDQ